MTAPSTPFCLRGETPRDPLPAILARYRAGATMAAIAAELGIGTTTVHSRLIDAGEPRRPRHGNIVTDDDRRQWRDLYDYGYGSSHIGKLYGRSPQVILNAIRSK